MNKPLIETKGNSDAIIDAYRAFIGNRLFPCIGAKASLAKDELNAMVFGNMDDPAYDESILQYLYACTDRYRAGGNRFFSAAVLFTGPCDISEALFETLFWQRLQALTDLDAKQYPYDQRVSKNIDSPDFSFSLKEEAYFIIGMHQSNSRMSRRFDYPAIIFNPHAQFELLKKENKYKAMTVVVRKRDLAFSGSVNPMLDDHGRSTELLQYSGKQYLVPPECPLHINHGKT